MSLTLVSIVVPIYNIGDYLDNCIDSCIRQTYKNLEILLINDGSTDISEKICKRYLEIDSRIKYIKKENGGLSDARNVGIINATGDYIFFLDGDDWLPENAIENLYKDIISSNADISIGCFKEVSSDMEVIKGYGPSENILLDGKRSLEKLIYYGNNVGIVVWNKLYKKELFDLLMFEKGKIHEDVFFTPKVLYLANKVSFNTNIVYFYRNDRIDSITNKKITLKNLDGLDGFKDNFLFFNNKKESKFALIYLTKYIVMIIEYYCLFSQIKNKNVAFKLSELYKQEYDKYFNKLDAPDNKKQIFKMKIFLVSPKLYYYIWRIRKYLKGGF